MTQNYQALKGDNENTRRIVAKINQEKEESVENIKRQYERQKQKELETIREYVHKVCIYHFYLNDITYLPIKIN